VRNVSGVSVSKIHDPTLTRERSGREVIAELVLLKVSVKSLEEVVVEGFSETALSPAGEDLESEEDRVPDDGMGVTTSRKTP